MKRRQIKKFRKNHLKDFSKRGVDKLKKFMKAMSYNY